jgi:hypothetical protein
MKASVHFWYFISRIVSILIVEASRSYSDTPHSVGLLWTSDQPEAETCTQHTTLKRERHPWPVEIRTHNPSKRVAADPRLRPRGHQYGPFIMSRSILLRMKKILDKRCVENPNKFCVQFLFPLKSCHLWDNGTAKEATDVTRTRSMRTACWITKTTGTHSEYVILFAFPRQECLRERASKLSSK